MPVLGGQKIPPIMARTRIHRRPPSVVFHNGMVPVRNSHPNCGETKFIPTHAVIAGVLLCAATGGPVFGPVKLPGV